MNCSKRCAQSWRQRGRSFFLSPLAGGSFARLSLFVFLSTRRVETSLRGDFLQEQT
jgi:hypothetical protein